MLENYTQLPVFAVNPWDDPRDDPRDDPPVNSRDN
jgi:hypothetical protein